MRELELYHVDLKKKKKKLNLACLKEKPIWIENLRFKLRIITIILFKKNYNTIILQIFQYTTNVCTKK